MTKVSYWLCCGDISLGHDKRINGECTEARRGFPQHCRFGTAEEHAQWSRQIGKKYE